MEIRKLAEITGLPAKTIRYYEEIGLLPSPKRKTNGYRVYSQTDVGRLKLVAGARRLDFSLAEIKEILDLRDHRIAPCGVLLELLERKSSEIEQRIIELQQLQSDLDGLFALGQTFPTNDVEGKNCVCHLVSEHTLKEATK